MLQSKGLSSRATEEDHERTRRLADAEMTIHQLEGLLERKDKEMLQLREVCVCVCVTGERRNKVHSGIPMREGVCLCVQPDVSVNKSNCVISRQGPWLLSLLAHNLVLIQHRNINRHAHKYTGMHPLSQFLLSTAHFVSFLTSLSAGLTSSTLLLFYTTAPSSGKMLLLDNR